MLRALAIRNFAIIDRLDVSFGPGLNVLTGETGAGKSILIDALTAILGGRVGAEVVRGGADRAIVDGVFDLEGADHIAAALADAGFECDDGELLITREIAGGGKSSARIGGRPATIGQLRALAEDLVDLHGQHDHQSLLSVPRHLDILDGWGGPEVLALREQVAETYEVACRLREERDNLARDARERAHLVDLYSFQVNEIGEAAPRPGEDEELEADAKRLANAQRLGEAAAAASDGLSGEGGGAVDSLAQAARALEDIADLDDRVRPILEALNAARYEAEEVAHDLRRYADSVELDPERLEQVEERLEMLRSLKRKYGDTLDEVVAYGQATTEKLNALTHSEERGAELDAEIARVEAEYTDRAGRLSELRRRKGQAFAEAVLAELADLGMARTRFEVSLEPCEPTARGADRVEFLISPNPGEPLRPLAKIASGGELSRVMLAIKSAMARRDPLPTMVFDEIDTGVGGRTAGVIADKLSALARGAQVLCITHLPQIAGRGDTHLYIEKQVAGERTTVSVSPLSQDERIEELARMLSGAETTEAVRRAARELLGLAE